MIKLHKMISKKEARDISDETMRASGVDLKNIYPEPGTPMKDGSIYIGIHDSRHWFAAAEDLKGYNGKRLKTEFHHVSGYMRKLDAHGHQDWHVPNKNILNLIWEARDKKGFSNSFNLAATAQYWSFDWDKGTLHPWGHLFETKEGNITTTGMFFPGLQAHVRPVRSASLKEF